MTSISSISPTSRAVQSASSVESKFEQNTISVQLNPDQKFDAESPSSLLGLGARAFAQDAIQETKKREAFLAKTAGPMTLQQTFELQAISKDLAMKTELMVALAKTAQKTFEGVVKAQ